MSSILKWNIRSITVFAIILPFFSCLSDWGFGNNRDVDLSKATWLAVERIPIIRDRGGIPGLPTPPIVPVDNLFSLPPGTKVNVKALGGTIDPTGTNILNDFDGDGILNTNETTTNVWVADYPMIEAIIAPPVTMKIAIQLNSHQVSDEIVSEIGSQDFVSNRNEGSEKIHQNELNFKTVQFQDTYTDSISLNFSGASSESFGGKYNGMGANYGTSSSKNWGITASTSKTLTKWADKPFVNNLDREAWNIKANSSSDKAMKYRRDKAGKINTESKVDPNAGYVRAALYIENQSVNMPVKIKNILCSLMFETGEGDLIPIQSFRLLNSDFSPFEVSVYGGTKFGPYVIELTGLNTAEVERAIASGYTPKIYIVDYEMSHVADSNYRSALLNFNGDNLKIVEENSKARTTLIKVFGPGFREMYRVAAFDAEGGVGDPCTTKSISTSLSPGVTLRTALKRIACSGLEIEFEDVVVDFSEIAPTLDSSRIFSKTIKSIGGIKNTIPCSKQENIVGSDNVQRTACVQKPISDWSQEDKDTAGAWVVFSKGKYYNFTEYLLYGENKEIIKFDPNSPRPASVLKGIDSTLWAGDTIEIIYISMRDYGAKLRDFGTNPLVTNLPFKMNTTWDLTSLGSHPYYPNTRSTYLGAVGFGEQIELTIKLDKTQYLNPDFGIPTLAGSLQYFTEFSYNKKTSPFLFERTEVADFEISMGFGGQRSSWMHIERDLNNSDPYKLQSCGVNFIHSTQTLTLCVKLPTQHEILDTENSVVELYIRPSLNNAYRKSIWPLHYSKVGKMRAVLASALKENDTSIRVNDIYGLIEKNDVLLVGESNFPFTIVDISAADAEGAVTLFLDQASNFKADKLTTVITRSGLTIPDIRITQDTGFLTKWNQEATTAFQPAEYNIAQNLSFSTSQTINCVSNPKHPVGCLGFNPDYNAINWIGNYNQGVALWSSWADGGDFAGFLSEGLFGLTTSNNLVYKLEPGNADFVVGEHTGASPLFGPVAITSGDYTLVLWRKDGDIWGKYYQNSTQTAVTTTLVDMTTATATGNFSAKVNENGKIILAWESNDDLYVSFWDINTRTKIGAESKVATRSKTAGTVYSIDVAIGTSRALVTWDVSFVTFSSVYTGIFTQHDTYARVYEVSTGVATNAAFAYSNYNSNFGWGKTVVSASASGNYAILANITAYDNGSSINVLNYNLSTAAAIGATKNIDSAGAGTSGSIETGSFWTGGSDPAYGLVIWRNVSGYLNARSFNLTTGATLGSGSFSIESNVVSPTWSLSVTQEPGMVLYSTPSDNNVRLKAISLIGNQMFYNNSLIVNSPSPATSRNPGSSLIVGTNIFSSWEHVDGSKKTIRGRVTGLDINAATPEQKFFLRGSGEFFLSTSNQGPQSNANITATPNTIFGMAFWLSQDTLQPRIRGFNVNLQNPGALQYGLNNFFVSPLIERDYTIMSRIKF
ncbi:LIC12048 family lipoprotein [Leptospira sarikeiensis]|uniref:Lipoprotein n=1 Tax=Leptospira sarikeiensis TaxID=2484943 RepID=A0A4R9KCJ8_9LEPT|nr:LIC12048 family lipoprotein [Leptospira sarikeiensis]TGL62851.1 hypothetical protein EHQ64_08045 [Leptospira sarikeiensis]